MSVNRQCCQSKKANILNAELTILRSIKPSVYQNGQWGLDAYLVRIKLGMSVAFNMKNINGWMDIKGKFNFCFFHILLLKVDKPINLDCSKIEIFLRVPTH